MCVSRIQRFMTAIVLGIVILLYTLGYTSAAIGLQSFVILMMVVWGLTNFCPSIWILKKMLPPCSWDK